MRLSFLPKIILNSVTDLSPQYLQQANIQLLMLDFDNTIVPYTTDTPTDEVVNWLKQMQQAQIQLWVVSNSRKSRVREFCRQYGLRCITCARKPFSKGIRRCLERAKLMPEACALVGDQIFTDTLGANGAGVTSILVPAIDNHNFWLKLRHVAELPFIFAARKRRMNR